MIIKDLGETGGISKAGNQWKKHEWVLETLGNYPRKVKFHVFGDRADTITFEMGKSYVISIDIESREFNERWYTDVSAFAARPSDQQMAPQAPAAGQPANPYNNPQPAAGPAFTPQPARAPSANPFGNKEVDFTAGDSTEDLPF